jgi:hypothetical protein
VFPQHSTPMLDVPGVEPGIAVFQTKYPITSQRHPLILVQVAPPEWQPSLDREVSGENKAQQERAWELNPTSELQTRRSTTS